MNIDKEKLIQDLKTHKKRYEWNNVRPNEYDSGYVMGLSVAIKFAELQPEAEMGQVAFDFDCAWMRGE